MLKLQGFKLRLFEALSVLFIGTNQAVKKGNNQGCKFTSTKQYSTLREKCPNTEFFSGPYFPVFGLNTEIYFGAENTDQKKLHIWTLFTQWYIET